MASRTLSDDAQHLAALRPGRGADASPAPRCFHSCLVAAARSPSSSCALAGCGRGRADGRRLRQGLRLRPARPPPPHLSSRACLSAADGGDGRRQLPLRRGRTVHIENRIIQHRPIELAEELTLRVRAAELRSHPRGQTFTLLSEAHVGRQIVWESVSTMLRRGGSGSRKPAEQPQTAKRRHRASHRTAEWRLGGDLGRRYAAVSGDRNPIHMHTLVAKPLGFPGAIAHGMWTKARCLAALESRLPGAFSVDVRFRRPILLPAKVSFASAAEGTEIAFAVRDAKRGTPHLDGQIEALEAKPKARAEGKKQSEAHRPRAIRVRARHGSGPAGAEPPRRLRAARPPRHAQARRASGLSGAQRMASARRRRAGRTFKAAQKLGARRASQRARSKGLFDLTPDDEQQMFQEAVRAFAAGEGPPGGASGRRRALTPAEELLAQAQRARRRMLGVPEELGGVMEERSAVTSVLVGEALAHGDMGIAYAALAPGAVATAIGRWGTRRAAGDLPARFHRRGRAGRGAGDLEPRPLFDPLKLQTTARRDGGRLDARRRQVARRPRRRVRAVPGRRRGRGRRRRRCSWSSPAPSGLSVQAEPAMGLRAAATGRLLLEGVRVRANAILGEGKSRRLRRVRAAARGSPGARSRSVPRRRCSTTSFPTSTSAGLRRADLQPPGRRLRRSPTSASSRAACACATYRAASLRRPRRGLRPRGRDRPPAVRRARA